MISGPSLCGQNNKLSENHQIQSLLLPILLFDPPLEPLPQSKLSQMKELGECSLSSFTGGYSPASSHLVWGWRHL